MDGHYIITSLLLAVLFSLFYARRIKASGSSLRSVYFFLLLFVCSLSAQLWIQPLGPRYFHIDLVLMLCLALVYFIAASAYSRANLRKGPPQKEKGMMIGLFFWLLLLLLIISVILGLSNSGPAV